MTRRITPRSKKKVSSTPAIEGEKRERRSPVQSGKARPNIEFKNEWQRDAWQTIENNDITFLTGIAGTAKTFIASAYAVSSLLDERCQQVFITRPTVEATGERLGFLPGDISAKAHPYLQPVYDVVDELLVNMSPEDKKVYRDKMHVLALGFARGRTMKHAVCILDEAQNATIEQMELWITRMGKGSKLIITGDPNQADIRNSALAKFISWTGDLPGVAHYSFPKEANMRHPLVEKIVEICAKARGEIVK